MPEAIDIQIRQLINNSLHGVAKAALDKSKEFAPVFTGKLKESGKLTPETPPSGPTICTEFIISYTAYNDQPEVMQQIGEYSYGEAASDGISPSEDMPPVYYEYEVYRNRPYVYPSNHPLFGQTRPAGNVKVKYRYVPVTGIDGSVRYLNPKGPQKENLSSPEFLEDALSKVFDDTFGTPNGLTRFGTNWSVRV